ncbi:hypothetical protein [Phnomibacter ginsenosidimutans]|uniref:DUF4233 domain-containing protein n=1 Tax=Phnomibacter ginsenosidimutans TaxID=2676868 RepID=A0A6I6GBS2_9BACT|nr:hypothetical protein [Phnomibacter ginsenosidimutans]QGW29904.1 hypothetical protein GLV81_18860 [Phnomibacter ginsenosidimutans]
MDNNTQPAPEEVQQPSIFDESVFTPGEYDKSIRYARTALFVVAGVQALVGAYYAYMSPDGTTAAVTLAITLSIAVVFLLLGFYSNKKPYTAILSGLIVYGALLLMDIVVDPTSILKGIIIKGVIIFYLAKSLSDAKEAQEGMKHLKGG